MTAEIRGVELGGEEETAKLLGEAGRALGADNAGLRRAAQTQTKKPSATEVAAVAKLGLDKQSLPLGYVSNALIYSPAFRYLPRKEHIAIVTAIASGRLKVLKVYTGDGWQKYDYRLMRP